MSIDKATYKVNGCAMKACSAKQLNNYRNEQQYTNPENPKIL